MEFIKAEEFLKQPVEVQKVLLEWWKPSIGDLYAVDKSYYPRLVDRFEDDCILTNGSYIWIEKDRCIPLLVEGQLRQFIEDKTGHKTDCCLDTDTYDINICEDNGFYIKKYEDIDSDLLQAYWKVAIEIAREDTHE